jgi:hypothetical protein
MEELTKALGYGSYPLEELNYLAARIGGIGDYDKETFLAGLEMRQYSRDIKTIINLAENITKFELQPAFSVEQYGEFLLENAKDISGPAFERLEQSADEDDRALAAHILKIESLVDPRAYGKTVVEEEQGSFTNYGYLTLRGEFQEVYHGQEDIPQEYRIFSHEEAPALTADAPSVPLRAPGEKESVMQKIREAKAAARSEAGQPKEQDRGGHKKSYEPEM